MGYCDEEECFRRAERAGKCWAHTKSIQRNGTAEDPRSELVRAALRLGDCDTNNDAEYRKREKQLMDAARRAKFTRNL